MQMEWFNELKTLREKCVSKYGVFSGSYFSIFSPNTGKYGPEKTPYLNTFHAVKKMFNRLLTHYLHKRQKATPACGHYIDR